MLFQNEAVMLLLSDNGQPIAAAWTVVTHSKKCPSSCLRLCAKEPHSVTLSFCCCCWFIDPVWDATLAARVGWPVSHWGRKATSCDVTQDAEGAGKERERGGCRIRKLTNRCQLDLPSENTKFQLLKMTSNLCNPLIILSVFHYFSKKLQIHEYFTLLSSNAITNHK